MSDPPVLDYTNVGRPRRTRPPASARPGEQHLGHRDRRRPHRGHRPQRKSARGPGSGHRPGPGRGIDRRVAEFTSYAHGTRPAGSTSPAATSAARMRSTRASSGGAPRVSARRRAATMYTLKGKNVAAASPPPPGSEGSPPHWTTYLASDDVDETARKIRDAGGTVLVDPFDVFDSGRMTIAQDPDRRRLRRLAGGHAHRRAARERARDAQLEPVPDRRPRPRRCFLRAGLRLRDRRVDLGGEEPFHVLKVEEAGASPAFAARCRS